MKQAIFDNIKTKDDLHLVIIKQDIQPAVPKTNFIDIKGANGSIDLTESLGVGVLYSDRIIEWTFGVYPSDDWADKRSEVSSKLNGKRFKIILGDDPDYYYDGRLSVMAYETDRLAHTITVQAFCKPFKLKNERTHFRITAKVEHQRMKIYNGDMRLYADVNIPPDGYQVFIDNKTASNILKLEPGVNEFEIYTIAGEEEVEIVYREGYL